MANKSLDTLFQALGDPTRRAVIARLTAGDVTVSDLADPHDMALPSFLKHLTRLEDAGLIRTRKEGRIRICTLNPEALSAAITWIDQQRALWEARLDRLETFLDGEDD
ncbi:MAG: metalloregulator ArsR/SmtB family transcription factor [Pseudomonadota bacterium]